MAIGIGISPTGYWGDIYPYDVGSFYSDAIQPHIIGYFTVGGEAIDPYDGGAFSEEQLDILCSNLRSAVTQIQTFSTEWPFTNPEQLEQYYSACRAYHVHPHKPRDQALRTLTECIALAEKARELGQVLVFCGD